MFTSRFDLCSLLMAYRSRVGSYEGHDVKQKAEAYHVDVGLVDQTFFPGNQSRDGNGTCSFRACASRRTLSCSVLVSTFYPTGSCTETPIFRGSVSDAILVLRMLL